MSDPKPFASLSSGLLARKGTAKPAMRPQGYGNFGSSLEDLGWDDMGHPGPPPVEHVPSSISALTPAPGGRGQHPDAESGEHFDPPVVEQQRALEASFEAPLAHEPAPAEEEEPIEAPVEIEDSTTVEESAAVEAPVTVEEPASIEEPAPSPVVPLPRRSVPKVVASAAASPKSKAAFTLRLDPDRHLRLRLACAVTRRSAQQIVTGALDEYLSSLPELEALAGHFPAGAGKRAGKG